MMILNSLYSKFNLNYVDSRTTELKSRLSSFIPIEGIQMLGKININFYYDRFRY